MVSSNPILLLTPTPAYATLLSSTSTSTAVSGSINLIAHQHQTSLSETNVFVESSLLFMEHYKRFTKLIYDSIDSAHVKNAVRSYQSEPAAAAAAHYSSQCLFHSWLSARSGAAKCSGLCTSPAASLSLSPSSSTEQLEPETPLEQHLERLVTLPRSLKAICRRQILNQMIEVQKKKLAKTLIGDQIGNLSLPKRVKNYLLYAE